MSLGYWVWIAASVIAISSLVQLVRARKAVLEEKLQTYLHGQAKLVSQKRKIMAEHRRRAELAKKIAEEDSATPTS